jgi:hypothetical protein
MHTLIVMAVGFVVLGICVLTGRALGGAAGIAGATLVFLPVWFIGAAINLYIGVKKAGYSIKDESPIFAIIFAIPAAVALFIWWKVRR